MHFYTGAQLSLYCLLPHLSSPPSHNKLNSKAHMVFLNGVILVNARTFVRYHP